MFVIKGQNTGQDSIGIVEFSFLFFGEGGTAYIRPDICSRELFSMFLNKQLTDEKIYLVFIAFTITKSDYYRCFL